MRERVTLADVARHCGLSPATVSRVLNGHPNTGIPLSTAERVRAAASELGYAPDPTARGLRTGRSEVIGFISDEVTVTPYASAMIRGILDTSEAANYGVLMAETDNHWERVGSASSSMRTRRVDGLLVGMQRARHVDLPFGPDTPPTIIVNGTADGHRHVLPDEYIAGLDSVRYLVERGHRRIGLIGQSAAFQDVRLSATVGRRIAGIERGMADAGLNPAYVVEGSEWEPELGHEGALQILRDSEATAIVAANGRIAFGVYQAVQEEGLMVGRDISVLSFGGEALASYLRPRVTTTRLPYQEMGRIAAEMLIARIKGEPGSDEQPQETLVPMPLIERDSVRDLR